MDYRNKQEAGPIEVFYGCRYSDHDWLFEDEMNNLVKEGIISNLNVAFSRYVKNSPSPNGDTGGDDRPRYVQHLIQNDQAISSRLLDLIINQNANVYICGDGNQMAKDVQRVIGTILQNHLGDDGTPDSGKTYLHNMKMNGRFLMDIWTG